VSSDLAPQLARNASYYAVRGLIAFAVLLALTPFVVRHLGPERYGIWSLAAVVTSYAQLTDLGISESLVKYAAEYRARGDAARLNQLVNTALLAFLGLALVAGGILSAAMPALAAGLLRIPEALQGEATLVFRLAVLAYLVNMVFGVFSTLVLGALRMGFTTAISLGALALTVAGTVLSLRAGWGLRGLALTALVAALATAAANWWVAVRLYPALQLDPRRHGDRAMLRQILSFSWKVQASSVAQLLIFQLDRVLLSRYLGLAAVAYYDVGSAAAAYARGFLVSLLSPVAPAASQLQAARDEAALAGLYRRAFKLAAAVVIPAFLVLAALAGPFVQRWMGGGFEVAALTLQLLVPAYAVNVLTAPGAFVLTGVGRPEVPMRSALVGALLNVALCYGLVRSVGYLGLVAGISAALVLSAGYFLWLVHRSLAGLGTEVYRRVALGPLAWGLVVAGAVWLLGRQVDLASLPALAAVVAASAGALAVAVWRTGYLDDFERRILAGLVRSALRRP
jgi:O-antigen/teichoic acid export membrane protein